MTESTFGTLVRVSVEDLDLFAAASHDVNPLHTSEDYARRTPFGERVVYGMFGVLTALGALSKSPGRELSSLSASFPQPMLTALGCEVRIALDTPEQGKVQLRDGRRTVAKVAARFRPAAGIAPTLKRTTTRGTPRAWTDSDFVEGLTLNGDFEVDAGALELLQSRTRSAGPRLPDGQIAVLLACSYLVGMELPGRSALFSSVSIEFEPGACPTGFEYTLVLETYDSRFSRLETLAKFSHNGTVFATARIKAFARRELPQFSGTNLAAFQVPSRDLDGHVALVTGASRGLGAATALAFAARGCTVLGNFHRSTSEAAGVAQQVEQLGGVFVPLQGDAADLDWWRATQRSVLERFGRLDFLVCNACPPVRSLWIEPASVPRLIDYIARSVALVAAPMAYMTELVLSAGGCIGVISSEAVRTMPEEWPHYVAAKSAVEALARMLAAEHPGLRVVIGRPPRLLTDLTNSPLAPEEGRDPLAIAVHLVARLAGAPGKNAGCELIEDFE